MSEAQNETPEVPEVDAPPDAEDPEIDKGAQAVELIGYVARECATFFKRLADGVRKYELTGDLPVRRGPAPKNGQKIGTEAPEKPKAKSKGRKGEDGEKVKRKRTASYFNMFVAEQVEFISEQRKAQAEADAKAGRQPAEDTKPTDTFRTAVAAWGALDAAGKEEYKQKKMREMMAAGLIPPPTEASKKSAPRKDAGSAAAPATAAPAPAAPAKAAPEPTPAGPESPTAAGAAASAPEAAVDAAADASPAPDAERRRKKKKKRKSEQVEPAGSLQTDGQLPEKKKKKKKKHHDNPEEGAGPSGS